MNRREFLRRCAALGSTMPFFSFLQACASPVEQRYANLEVNFEGKVIIVGAGAAGLAAGYILARHGVEFEILEASSVFGGRVKRADDFADFPIDLGGEWLHDATSVLAELVDDPDVDASVEMVPYSPESISIWSGGRLRKVNFGGNYYSEYKFKSTTWYGFLERFIAPAVVDHIRYDTPVMRIDHSGERVQLSDAQGVVHEAERVLVTTPIKVLQDGIVEYVPALPSAKLDALARVTVSDGFKVFFEFAERFYPDMTIIDSVFSEYVLNKMFYDAAFRKDSSRNILALFHVGPRATDYVSMDEDALVETLLGELDAIFDGQASASFMGAIVQNWSAQPFVRGAYPTSVEGSEEQTVEALLEPLGSRVYFAGAGMSLDNMSTVHGAMQSAYSVVASLLAQA